MMIWLDSSCSKEGFIKDELYWFTYTGDFYPCFWNCQSQIWQYYRSATLNQRGVLLFYIIHDGALLCLSSRGTSAVALIKMLWILINMSPGGISRSHPVEQRQTVPSVCQVPALYMRPPASPDTSVWMRISLVRLTTSLCVIVSLHRASLSYRSMPVSVFRLTAAHGCHGVGGCFGAASTAVLKRVKICSATTTGTANLWLHSLASALHCRTCQTLLWPCFSL